MPHYKHVCPKVPEGYLESLEENYGWEGNEVPVNSDSNHPDCPWCHMKFDDPAMKACSGREVKRLSGSPGNA